MTTVKTARLNTGEYERRKKSLEWKLETLDTAWEIAKTNPGAWHVLDAGITKCGAQFIMLSELDPDARWVGVENKAKATCTECCA